MQTFFTNRPGVYLNYENYGLPVQAKAADGVCAAVIQAVCKKNGEAIVGEVIVLENANDITKKYEFESGSHIDVLNEMFLGGATKIYAVCLDNTDKTAYEQAFVLLEPFRWNVIAIDIDTDVSEIQSSLKEYLDRIYDEGKFVMGVVGEPTTVPLNGEDGRLVHAANFDDYKIIYVGAGFKGRDGKTRDGYLAAARIAGMIAGTPSNESITHKVIAGATALTENLTNSEQIDAANSGMITFSTSANGTIWIEAGVNTLKKDSIDGNEDEGWKKIKRVKIRFELMQRINDTVENLIGKINNDPDGRATIIQSAQGVCNSMVNEKKLLSGAKVVLDDANPPEGENAWFIIYADDIDSVERMYFTFKFRFAPEEDLPKEEPAEEEPTEPED